MARSIVCPLLPFAGLLAACADAPSPTIWEGRVDSLPSGTIVVVNPARGVWDSATAWRAVEDLRIGSVEGDEAAAFGRIAALAVDPAGRISVLDQQAQEVRVFGSDGTHIRTIGRKGGGPGEFAGADALWADETGRLWVSDRTARRFSVFDSAGVLLGDHPRSQAGFFLEFIGGSATGDLWDAWWAYDAAGEPLDKVLRRFADGAYRDTLTLPRFVETQWQVVRRQGTSTMRFNLRVPFTAVELLAVEPLGGVWRAVTNAYRLTRFDLRGDSTRVVLREHTPIPVSAADREGALRRYRTDFADDLGAIDESLIPAAKPAMWTIVVDDLGYLWVVPYTADDRAAIAFDVFDPEGRYLGAVPTPVTPQRLRPRPVVRGDALYYVTTDELDVPYVVRVRIEGRKDP
jgi:hypothetical protein